ncbi:MAG: CoA transferase [Rhodospirillales bacterium]|nr:CoA transferase [Rhodospirillales bacterium]
MTAEASRTKTEAHLPLSGVMAVELGHSVAAPFAGQALADLGATVVKVENPSGGDDARQWGPPFWHGASATFQSLNRNKLSVAIDIKNPAEQKRLRGLMAQADVVLQNMRPGMVEKFGLDAETLRRENPALVYCNLGAFGSIGPLRERTGYDPLMQAFAGIMSVTGEPERPPVRVGPSIIDMGAGLWCVIGILAALLRRRETGEGCTIDASLYETALAWMTVPIANSLASGREPGRSGSETPMLAPYKAYKAQDRYIIIAAGNDNLFRRLCATIGRPEWAEDPRFRTNPDRVTNRVALNGLLDEVIGTAPAAHWVEKLDEAGVPCAPLQTVSEVLNHPQTKALGMVTPTPDGAMQLVAMPLRFDGKRPPVRRAPPALGADRIEEIRRR